jgi:hypothetical protein
MRRTNFTSAINFVHTIKQQFHLFPRLIHMYRFSKTFSKVFYLSSFFRKSALYRNLNRKLKVATIIPIHQSSVYVYHINLSRVQNQATFLLSSGFILQIAIPDSDISRWIYDMFQNLSRYAAQSSFGCCCLICFLWCCFSTKCAYNMLLQACLFWMIILFS